MLSAAFAHPTGWRQFSRIVLVGQAGDALLHLLHLLLEALDLVAAGRRRLAGLRRGGRAGACRLAAEWGKHHREGALEHLHVPPRHVLEWAEAGGPECLRHLVAELALLAREVVDRDLEIARH